MFFTFMLLAEYVQHNDVSILFPYADDWQWCCLMIVMPSAEVFLMVLVLIKSWWFCCGVCCCCCHTVWSKYIK